MPDGHINFCKSCKSNEGKNLRQQRKARVSILVPDLKRCYRCDETLPGSHFYTNKGNSDGLSTECKSCSKARTTQWRKDNPLQRTLARYGLTQAHFDAMYESQQGKCAICEHAFSDVPKSKHSVVIDHCHTSNVVRALLCTSCNGALGLFGEDVSRMERATSYVRKFEHLKHQ